MPVNIPGSIQSPHKTDNSGHSGHSFPDTFQTEKGDWKGNEKQDNTQAEEKPLDRWKGILIGDLQADTENVSWAWEGYIGPQVTTLFTGLWKAGKSTLVSLLLRDLALEEGTFCGQTVSMTKVLLVTEEAAPHWIERRDDLGIGNHVSVISKPFLRNPTRGEWPMFVTDVALQVRAEEYGLVIFDSIFNLWAVEDENNASQVKEALMPLNMILEARAGVVLVGHPSKGDGGEGRATRGSGALPAFVDIIVEMRRYDAEHRTDTRRVLTAYSRYKDTPPELVIELDMEGMNYRAVGTKAEVKVSERADILMELLPFAPTAYNIKDVSQNWPEGLVRPGEKTLKRDLDKLVEYGRVAVRGTGVKGDEFRWHRA